MKWIIRIVVALIAFLLGMSASEIIRRQPKLLESKPNPHFEIVYQPTTKPADEPWQRVAVKGRFSFLIPSYLKDDGHSLSKRMAVGAFRREAYDMKGVYHLYYYSDSEPAYSPKESNRYRSTTRSELMVSGKPAIVITEIPALNEILCIHDVPEVSVYFRDIGRGRGLIMRLSGGDEKDLDDAKRIIASIEFP